MSYVYWDGKSLVANSNASNNRTFIKVFKAFHVSEHENLPFDEHSDIVDYKGALVGVVGNMNALEGARKWLEGEVSYTSDTTSNAQVMIVLRDKDEIHLYSDGSPYPTIVHSKENTCAIGSAADLASIALQFTKDHRAINDAINRIDPSIGHEFICIEHL